MNPADFALRKRTVMVVLTIMLIAAGLLSYQKLGRLENPNFTIKTALIVTPYPGASPSEVAEEVTDPIEEAVQAMSQLKEVYSTSKADVSMIYVDIKDKYSTEELPQIWDELRRKVNDVQGDLPPGAEPSIVRDDFGDVYGVFFALTGDGRSYAELKDYAETLKTELLSCKDVAKIEYWGRQQELVYVEFDRARLAELGLSPEAIMGALQTQNAVVPGGKVEVGGNYLRISPTGDFADEQLIADLYIGGEGSLVRLGDVAKVTRGYLDPPRQIMTFNGKPAIGIGISTVAGGNVITMGDSIKARLVELKPAMPEGMELHKIYIQSERVTRSVNDFVVNLIESVIIVVVLLMFFMGWQSGLLIGVVLLLTILSTLAGMYIMHIDLQKVSLGALVLALGMLVDNAIVVADGILVRVERGGNREDAARDVVRATQWPLLGATLIAVLAFAAIGFSVGEVGEFCRSLYTVMALSLLLSWVLAVTITPLLCVWFLKIPETQGEDPYDKPMFRRYRRFLHEAIRRRVITVTATVSLLVAALFGFRFVEQAFFPDSTSPYFYINYWRPSGTHIERTAEDIGKISAYMRSLTGVKNVSTYTGEGTLRFLLSYNYEMPDPAYGMLLVEVDDYRKIPALIQQSDIWMKKNYPDAEPYSTTIPNGPPIDFKVEARFAGPDREVLRKLAEQAEAIVRSEPSAKDVRLDWRQPVQVLRPEYAELQARRVGVTRADLALSLQYNFNGINAGLYREGNDLIPIVGRPPDAERATVDNFENVQVWSSLKHAFIPIGQVVTELKQEWEWPLIKRRDRRPCVTVRCQPLIGLAEPLRLKIKDRIEAIELPPGYHFQWAGECKKSKEAKEPLAATFPLCVVGMFIILVSLFNSVRRSLIIFMTVPLALIGVVAGLLLTGIPFGFMAILGFLGLSGMIIKNAIVLIDEVEVQLTLGVPAYKAVLDSAVSRMRPVMMAAGTTILGMAPLMTDPLYAGMAVTIMGGLLIATFLTLILVPVVYTMVYSIPAENEHL